MAASIGDSAEGESESIPPTPDDDGNKNRRRAALAALPFLAIGIADVVLLYGWGLKPLWAFAILPPILFCTVLAWIVFSTDFLEDRT